MSLVIEEALALPSGARFHRCAFQVNPYDYLVRHGKRTDFADEGAYNSALVTALVAAGIEVIAVTDHYRIRSAAGLIAAAKAAGIVVFPGFEASTSEGIHILCLFDPSCTVEQVQGKIHACGVYDESAEAPLGHLTAAQLLDKCQDWGMQCVAAHVCSANGVLRALDAGQAKAAIWRHSCLAACSIPGPVTDLPIEYKPILQNKNPAYKRERPIAVLNSQDVSHPDDTAKTASSCWVKMTEPTLEGLRQAFLDPASRVRLASDPAPEEHVEFLAMAWESAGFLSGCRLHFNENLNVLIGGRGSGKSTVIESLRYVLNLEPIGAEAKKVHDGIVSGVLKSGTKISLAVRSYRPDRRLFIIERTVNNPSVVRDETGNVLPLKPTDVVRQAAIFGQNEISELARSPEKLTALLDRFITVDPETVTRHKEAAEALAQSRRDLLDCEKKLADIDEQLSSLPGLEETLGRYRGAGVEEKLKDQALIVREEGIVRQVEDSLQPFRDLAADLKAALPVGTDAVEETQLADLPGKERLATLKTTLTTFQTEVAKALGLLEAALSVAKADIADVGKDIADRKEATRAAFEKTLRDLQKEKVDGDEFMRLQQSIERLRPLREQRARIGDRAEAVRQKRRNELAAWEDLKRARFEMRQRAAKKVSRQLTGQVRVKVTAAGNRQPLLDLLRQKPAGRLSEALEALQRREDVSVAALADALRRGAGALAQEFAIPAGQAQRLVEAGSELPMLIEELDLPSTTDVELNVAAEGAEPEWRPLPHLSTGQKATAMLYLLLIESDGPLVIDQLEDNLDNRFISDGIVPKIKSEKRRRQFLFATHNANIPVLGDAELILGLSAVGEAGDGHVEVPAERMGSIDTPSVALLVKEILEGGKDAFTTRRLKYGF